MEDAPPEFGLPFSPPFHARDTPQEGTEMPLASPSPSPSPAPSPSDLEQQTPKRRGRPPGPTPYKGVSADKRYIKKGEPGYKRPKYSYVRKRVFPGNDASVDGMKGNVPISNHWDQVWDLDPVPCRAHVGVLPDWLVPKTAVVTSHEALTDAPPLELRADPGWAVQLAARDAAHLPAGGPGWHDNTRSSGATCHAGAPVWSLDWAAVGPDRDAEHFFAVGTREAAHLHAHNEDCTAPNVVQIWSVGTLGRASDCPLGAPRYVMGLLPDGGGCCWTLRFNPHVQADDPEVFRAHHALHSAGAAEPGGDAPLGPLFHPRLGVLAVAHGCRLTVVAVPHPAAFPDGPPPLVSLLCTATLDLPPNTSCWALEWSPHSPTLLLAGCSDGSVSLYDLAGGSPYFTLMRACAVVPGLARGLEASCAPLRAGTVDRADEPAPTQAQTSEQGHELPRSLVELISRPVAPLTRLRVSEYPIRGVAWCPASDRYFATGGHDGHLRVFDLRDPLAPLFDRLWTRAWILQVVWPCSELVYTTLDDFTFRVMHLPSFQHRSYHIQSPLWAAHANPWTAQTLVTAANGRAYSVHRVVPKRWRFAQLDLFSLHSSRPSPVTPTEDAAGYRAFALASPLVYTTFTSSGEHFLPPVAGPHFEPLAPGNLAAERKAQGAAEPDAATETAAVSTTTTTTSTTTATEGAASTEQPPIIPGSNEPPSDRIRDAPAPQQEARFVRPTQNYRKRPEAPTALTAEQLPSQALGLHAARWNTSSPWTCHWAAVGGFCGLIRLVRVATHEVAPLPWGE